MINVNFINDKFVVINKRIYEIVDNYLIEFFDNNKSFYAEFNNEIKEFILYTGECLGHGVRGLTWETRVKSIDGEIDMAKHTFKEEATCFFRYVNDIELKCKYPELLKFIN